MADEQKFFFLNLISAGVNGGSTKVGHQNWVECDSWSFSMNQAAEPNSNGGQPKSTAASGRFGFTMKHAGPADLQERGRRSFYQRAGDVRSRAGRHRDRGGDGRQADHHLSSFDLQ